MIQPQEKTNDRSCQLSVVIPVYHSYNCLPELISRLHLILRSHLHYYEIILVDDASQDLSWRIIEAQSKIDPLIRGIHRQQNGGKDQAIWDGLQIALGSIIVIMDDDLQHDPQDIIPLFQSIQSGYDLCYAVYLKNRQNWLKNSGSWLHGKFASYFGNKSPILYLSPFKSLDRKLLKKSFKHNTLILIWMDFASGKHKI